MEVQQVVKLASAKSKVVGIFFSANYCVWCKNFTPRLKEVYPHFDTYNIDIVMVGSDKTKDVYNTYAAGFPWPVVSFDDPIRAKLRKHFDIKTIPALVFVDMEGNVINTDGRELVVDCMEAYEVLSASYIIASRLGSLLTDYDSDNSEW